MTKQLTVYSVIQITRPVLLISG